MTVLRAPLTAAQIIEGQNEQGFIRGVVALLLFTAIDNNLEG